MRILSRERKFNQKGDSMQEFIGVKRIKAEPMTRLEYNIYRGWKLPEDENGNDDGMLVEYLDSQNGNHKNHAGYIDWSPIYVFNEAYRATTGMNFGLAIEAIKKGMKVARGGWNGKGVFIELAPSFDIEKEAERSHDNWMKEKLDKGITSRRSVDDGEEFMVPYKQLSEKAKNLDRLQFTQQINMTSSYIFIDTTGLQTNNPKAPKCVVPWSASQTDMLSDDWEIVE